jgi:hypothetical protein
MTVRIVKSVGATGVLPTILSMHGGGWVLGNAETHDRLVRELAVGANAAVVSSNTTGHPRPGIRSRSNTATRPRDGSRSTVRPKASTRPEWRSRSSPPGR